MKRIIFWETILILATVPIFRSIWILLDSADWLNEPVGIFVSFAGGVIVTVWALVRIHSK